MFEINESGEWKGWENWPEGYSKNFGNEGRSNPSLYYHIGQKKYYAYDEKGHMVGTALSVEEALMLIYLKGEKSGYTETFDKTN